MGTMTAESGGGATRAEVPEPPASKGRIGKVITCSARSGGLGGDRTFSINSCLLVTVWPGRLRRRDESQRSHRLLCLAWIFKDCLGESLVST